MRLETLIQLHHKVNIGLLLGESLLHLIALVLCALLVLDQLSLQGGLHLGVLLAHLLPHALILLV